MRDSIRNSIISGGRRTGKTQRLAKLLMSYSEEAIPVFVTDTKSELHELLVREGRDQIYPNYWDVYGERGLPIWTSVSDVGAILMSRILDLNALQEGVLRICYRLEDEHGYLLLDLDDLQSVLSYLADHAGEVPAHYGKISAATLGAISRRVLAVQDEKGDRFFGEPALDVLDLFRSQGSMGSINILDAEILHGKQTLYSAVLLWLLSALIEKMEDSRDGRCRFVFAIDRAEQLFRGSGLILEAEIVPLLRQARRKGIAVILVLDDASVLPGSIQEEFDDCLEGDKEIKPLNMLYSRPEADKRSELYLKYARTVDRYSAKELLEARMLALQAVQAEEERQSATLELEREAAKVARLEEREQKNRYPMLRKMANSAVTTIGREIGKQFMRGIMDVLKR